MFIKHEWHTPREGRTGVTQNPQGLSSKSFWKYEQGNTHVFLNGYRDPFGT